MSDQEHLTVLLHEAVESLVTDRDGLYVDGTFGRGGHSRAILEQLSPQGRLLAVDKDPQAIAAGEQLAAEDSRFEIVQGSFAELPALLEARGLVGSVKGVLLDLGVSSPQLDQAERGFSFLRDGALDMRMDPTRGLSAAEWLADAEEQEMAKVFKEYGEERFAKRLARAIVAARQETPILRTTQLAEIVAEAHPAWEKHKHPATRVFQAIRIYLNRELDDLRDLLDQLLPVLAVGGRMAIISFHSLEDRMVKRFIKLAERGEQLPAHIPVMDSQIVRTMRSVGKAIKASDQEVAANPRARSAIMRVAEKLA